VLTRAASAERPPETEIVTGPTLPADAGHVGLSNRILPRALVALAMLPLAFAATAGAHALVVLPSPGVMEITNLPSQVRGGEQFTLVENMPDGILGGVVHFQRESPSGTWWTMASAPVRPWVFWLHWHVPKRWAGSQIHVRFLLTDGGQFLAGSPDYSMTVG
jgi:hypothetical protein